MKKMFSIPSLQVDVTQDYGESPSHPSQDGEQRKQQILSRTWGKRSCLSFISGRSVNWGINDGNQYGEGFLKS